jgi:uncharacterized protein YdhG (YjbR/CyaY superfamily)
VEGRHDTEPLNIKEGGPEMPAKDAKAESGGFSAEERAAMKERAAELRAEGNKGAKKADGLQAVLDGIAKMAPEDRVLAERVHVTVTATAPELSPKTWYGMPAYANADGKVVVFFQDAGKFKYRYSTLGFQDAANLDDGDVWPVSYALKKWSPMVEKKVAELVKAAISCPCRDRSRVRSPAHKLEVRATRSRGSGHEPPGISGPSEVTLERSGHNGMIWCADRGPRWLRRQRNDPVMGGRAQRHPRS